jgi:hypothetical protein
MTFPLLLAIPIAVSLTASAAVFDRVVLTDGRIIEGDIQDSDDPDHLLLRIRSVDVLISNDLISTTFRENLDNYEPANKKEEDYLKRGWVLFEGRWMAKTRREQELSKRASADKRAIKEILDRQKWKNAIEISSPHFTLKSNCDEALIEAYAARLEQFYKYFRQDWGVKLSPGERKGKLGVDLFRSFSDQFRISSAGGEIMISFNFGTGDISLTRNRDDPDEGWRDMYEAVFNQLSFYINPKFQYPRWFRASMAEYFATARVDEKGKFHLGEPNYGYVFRLQQALDDGSVPPLIAAIHPDDHEYESIHRPMRWSFIHFLMQSPDYGKATKAFYTTLSHNRDANIRQGVSWYRQGAAVGLVEEPDLLHALEKRLSRSIDELEQEWLDSLVTDNADYPANAFAQAGNRALTAANRSESDSEGEELVESVFEYFAQAADKGMPSAYFYRNYAQLLRKGGIDDTRRTLLPHRPDGPGAWKMIEIAIEKDPVDPYNYTEAAGILIIDGPLQDLDRAADYAATAMGIAGPRNYSVKSLHHDLMALIEPAREAQRVRAENAADRASRDQRIWLVQPYYLENEATPEQLSDLSTQDIRDLIEAGTLDGKDWVYQTYYDTDPATGDPQIGEELWNHEWVQLKDVPVFEEDLAASAP